MIGSSGAYIAFIVPVSGVLCYVNFVGTMGSDLMYLGAPDSTGTTQITVLGKVASNLGTGTSEVRMMDTTQDFTGPINLGNPTESTMLELAEAILRLTQSKSKLIFQSLFQALL